MVELGKGKGLGLWKESGNRKGRRIFQEQRLSTRLEGTEGCTIRKPYKGICMEAGKIKG